MRACDRSLLNNPKYWRRRAKDARASAEQTSDRKHMMLGFAEGYERVADRIEKLAEKSLSPAAKDSK
jgi:hypothetical protein